MQFILCLKLQWQLLLPSRVLRVVIREISSSRPAISSGCRFHVRKTTPSAERLYAIFSFINQRLPEIPQFIPKTEGILSHIYTFLVPFSRSHIFMLSFICRSSNAPLKLNYHQVIQFFAAVFLQTVEIFSFHKLKKT